MNREADMPKTELLASNITISERAWVLGETNKTVFGCTAADVNGQISVWCGDSRNRASAQQMLWSLLVFRMYRCSDERAAQLFCYRCQVQVGQSGLIKVVVSERSTTAARTNPTHNALYAGPSIVRLEVERFVSG